MRPLAKLGTSALVVGLFASFGCSAQAPSDPGNTKSDLGTAPAVAQKPDVKEHARWNHHQRPELLEAALRLPSLTDAQRPQIQAELDKLHAAHQAMRQAGETLRTATSTAIKSGSIDPGAFGPQLDAMDKAAAGAATARTDAMVRIHDILTADQRKELVSTLKAHMPKAGERAAFADQGHFKGARNWAGAGKVAGEHCDGPKGEHGLLKGLDLTEAQRQQLADLKFLDGDQNADKSDKPDFAAKFAEHRAAFDKMLVAFQSDTFDASSVPAHADMASFMRKHMERRIAMLAKVLPILDAGQRTKLVERLDNPELMRPAMQGHMRGMMQRPGMPGAPAQQTPIN